MRGEVYSGSIIIDVLNRERDETKRGPRDSERRPVYLKWSQNHGVEAGRLRGSRNWNQHMRAIVRQYIGFLKMASFEWD